MRFVDDATVDDSGNGDAPVIDLGPLEFIHIVFDSVASGYGNNGAQDLYLVQKTDDNLEIQVNGVEYNSAMVGVVARRNSRNITSARPPRPATSAARRRGDAVLQFVFRLLRTVFTTSAGSVAPFWVPREHARRALNFELVHPR